MQQNSSYPEQPTPQEILKEVAEILARGYLRLKKRSPYIPELSTDDLQEADLPDPPVHMPMGKDTSPVYQETT